MHPATFAHTTLIHISDDFADVTCLMADHEVKWR